MPGLAWRGAMKTEQVVLEVLEPTMYARLWEGRCRGYGDTREGETDRFDFKGQGECCRK